MTLQDFYDRLAEVAPSLPEGSMRSRLVEAMEAVSKGAGVPRVRVAISSVATSPAAGASPVSIRNILSAPPEAGPGVSLEAASWTGADLSGLGEGVLDVVLATGACAPFSVDVEGLPDAVPADASSAEGAAFEVPWPEACLNYVLSELAMTAGRPEVARLHYARYERALLEVKREARRVAGSESIHLVADPAIWP